MATVQDLLDAGCGLPGDSPRRDAEILLGHCLGRPRVWLYTWPEREVAPARSRAFAELLERRRRGEPLAYLTGSREFWSLRLTVTDATLIPRPETETLVAWALELDVPSRAGVLDLGTGSGAIALAVAGERPDWRVEAVDRCGAALAVARDNAARAGLARVQFRISDWYGALGTRRFDLLLSNPPYVDGDDSHLDRAELRYEPRGALVAADAGLSELRRVVEGASQHLHPGGWLLLEHGFEQGAAVRGLLAGAGFAAVGTRRDLSGHERVSAGQLAC